MFCQHIFKYTLGKLALNVKVTDVSARLLRQTAGLAAGWSVGEKNPCRGLKARTRVFEPRAAEQAVKQLPVVKRCFSGFILYPYRVFFFKIFCSF
jgi:hypothetical protein